MDLEQNKKDLIYLISCAVNETIPDHVQQMDVTGIYSIAERHLLCAAVSFALQSAGVVDSRITAYIARAQKKLLILDHEKARLCEHLERAGIWYIPLKGIVLKDYYPKLGMREMVDCDMLYDASRSEDLKQIMESLDFVSKAGNENDNHDVYRKSTGIEFEMHKALFMKYAFNETQRLVDYYSDIQKKKIKDDSNHFGYHLSNEDFYIYLVAHEYKHFIRGGVGIRSLVDIYVFLKRFGNLNWVYIQQEVSKLGIQDFEMENRDLAIRTFSTGLSQNNDTIEYMLDSGTFGNMENFVHNRIERAGSRCKYIWKRLFLSSQSIKEAHPIFYRHRLLIPLLPIYRLYRFRKKEHSTLKKELITIKKHKRNER